jgi:ATP phosphoribosyltransferase regulatory subunit
VRSLREAGETVLALLPGHELETQALDIDRELVASGGRWVVQSVGAAKHTS